MDTDLLLYTILVLQVTLLLLICSIVGVVWFKYHKRASEIVDAGEKVLNWISVTFLDGEPDLVKERVNGKRNLTVYDVKEISQSDLKEFSSLTFRGTLADELYGALRLCSGPNLARIHSAARTGPDELKRVVNDIDPESQEIDAIREHIGPSVLATLAYNYRIENYSEFGRQLTLVRKS
jgi:hypothetical protein